MRRLCFVCLVGVGIVDLMLWPFTTVRLDTPLIHGMINISASALVTAGALQLLLPRLEAVGLSPANLSRLAYVQEFVLVFGVNVTFPLCITVATYLIASVAPGPWVDPWLARPEELVGLTQPVIRAWVESHGLLGISNFLYGTPPAQGMALLAYCALVRREFTPAWEFATYATVAAVAVLVAWFFLPALSPFVHYGVGPPIDPPLFVTQLRALRSGEPFALEQATGLLTMPSFHVVFALLLAWVYRSERYVFPFAIALNVGVALSIVPSGWHYISDVVGGILWTIGAVLVTDRIVARMLAPR